MPPLRILYIIDGLGSGGAQRQLVTLIRAADREIIAPEVAYYRDRTHFVPELIAEGVPVHPLVAGGGRDPRTLARIARLIRENDYDLIHTYLARPGILARLATFAGGPPVVLSERSVSLGRTAWVRITENLMAGRAAGMIVNAEAIREHVEDAAPAWRGRITLVPNGVDVEEPTGAELEGAAQFRRENLRDENGLLFVTVARLADAKDPHMLLDALAALPDELRQRLSIVWVGSCRDAAFGESVKRRAAKLGLGETIRFLDPVRDVRPLYLAADAALLTSAWEGFPNAVLEALSLGRPVIATGVGDVRALVKHGETGLLAEPGDPALFAGRMEAFAGMDEDARAAMGARGRALVQAEYSSDALFERTLAVYRRVLAARAA